MLENLGKERYVELTEKYGITFNLITPIEEESIKQIVKQRGGCNGVECSDCILSRNSYNDYSDICSFINDEFDTYGYDWFNFDASDYGIYPDDDEDEDDYDERYDEAYQDAYNEYRSDSIIEVRIGFVLRLQKDLTEQGILNNKLCGI